MDPGDATVEVLWEAYEALDPAGRQQLAERILQDRRLLEDLTDHVLIEKAKKARGKPVALKDYKASRG